MYPPSTFYHSRPVAYYGQLPNNNKPTSPWFLIHSEAHFPVSTQLEPGEQINMKAKKLQLTLTHCYGGRLIIVLKLELINTTEGAKCYVWLPKLMES